MGSGDDAATQLAYTVKNSGNVKMCVENMQENG